MTVAIDIGSESTRVALGRTVIAESPSQDPKSGKPVVAHGVIVDEEAASRLVHRIVAGTRHALVAGTRVVTSCPLHIDYASGRLRQAMHLAGAGEVEVIRSTAAAAAGAGIDVTSGFAEMLVDVGAALTEIAVFRDDAVLYTRTIPIGAWNLRRGVLRTLSGQEEPPVPPAMLADHVAYAWRSLPEKAQVEVIENGLVVTGGGAQQPDLIAALESSTRLTVRVPERPAQAVIRGLVHLGRALRAA